MSATQKVYLAGVRALILWTTIIWVLVVSAWAQGQHHGFISLRFEIDGTAARCDDFQVQLRFNGESLHPKQNGQRFEVPEVFKVPATSWREDQRVDISLACQGHTLTFPGQHPAFIRDGDWKFGIAYPLYALSEYGYTHEFDRGTWLGYLIFEGEPGEFTLTSQTDPPDGLPDSLLKEQPHALPDRTRDIAYMLAVFNVDYRKNRDYLLSSLNNCLSRPKDSPENDVCDSDLFSFVANLYWRGDSGLMEPLLQIAESRKDVIGSIGTFYADLLDRQDGTALAVMRELPDAKQQLVCSLADEDDLTFDPPKKMRIKSLLDDAKDTTASRCSSALGSD